MKKLIIISGLTIIIFSLGCGGNDKQSIQQSNSTIDTLHQKHQESKANEAEEVAGKLVLNNGNKWQANAETTEGIQKMLASVNDHLSKGNTDNKILSENLDKEFTSILQRCTMSGDAHTQLHNFLLPLKDRIEKLKENPDNKPVLEIQSYLNDYKNYFQ